MSGLRAAFFLKAAGQMSIFFIGRDFRLNKVDFWVLTKTDGYGKKIRNSKLSILIFLLGVLDADVTEITVKKYRD